MVSVGIDFSGGIRSDSFALREDPGRFGRGGLPDREQECQAVILAEAIPVLLPGPGSPWCDPQRGGPFGPLCRRQHSRQPQFLNWESSSSGLSRKVGHPDTGREDAGEKLRRVMFAGGAGRCILSLRDSIQACSLPPTPPGPNPFGNIPFFLFYSCKCCIWRFLS